MNKYDKNTGLIVFWLIVMYISSFALYISDPLYSDKAFLIGLINFLIISVVMMAVPFIKYFSNGNKRIPKNSGLKLCLWNSIILFILSTILTALYKIGIVGGVGTVVYYFVNKWMFVDYLDTIHTTDENTVKVNKKSKVLYKCSDCGELIDENATKCPNCGANFNDYLQEDNKIVKTSSSELGKKYDDLMKLKDMLDKKIITKEEFNKEKKKILENK